MRCEGSAAKRPKAWWPSATGRHRRPPFGWLGSAQPAAKPQRRVRRFSCPLRRRCEPFGSDGSSSNAQERLWPRRGVRRFSSSIAQGTPTRFELGQTVLVVVEHPMPRRPLPAQGLHKAHELGWDQRKHRILAMADAPHPGIAGLEMLLERLSALESHARMATAFRQRDAEALPAGSELTSDIYDCGTYFRINKHYEGRLRTCDLVVLEWDSAMSKCLPDMNEWCNATSVMGATEVARLRAACLPLLLARPSESGTDSDWDEIKTADLGIIQGSCVPVSFFDWWLNEGLKAFVPEVVAATWGSAVLDLRAPGKGYATQPLARIFEIVQLLISSAGFEADPKFAIDMTIAPRWQAGLLKAEIANGEDAMEAQRGQTVLVVVERPRARLRGAKGCVYEVRRGSDGSRRRRRTPKARLRGAKGTRRFSSSSSNAQGRAYEVRRGQTVLLVVVVVERPRARLRGAKGSDGSCRRRRRRSSKGAPMNREGGQTVLVVVVERPRAPLRGAKGTRRVLVVVVERPRARLRGARGQTVLVAVVDRPRARL